MYESSFWNQQKKEISERKKKKIAYMQCKNWMTDIFNYSIRSLLIDATSRNEEKEH